MFLLSHCLWHLKIFLGALLLGQCWVTCRQVLFSALGSLVCCVALRSICGGRYTCLQGYMLLPIG